MGYRVKPRGIVAVNSADGDNIYDVHIERTRVLPETTAFQMVTMLQDVVARGTGARVRGTGAFTARSAARPARPTTTTTRGSSASLRRSWRGCGWASISPSRFATAPRAPAIGAADLGGLHAPHHAAAAVAAVPRARRACSRCECAACRIDRPVDGCPTYTEYFKEGDDIPSALCPIHEGTFKQEAQRVVQGVLSGLGKAIRGIFK